MDIAVNPILASMDPTVRANIVAAMRGAGAAGPAAGAGGAPAPIAAPGGAQPPALATAGAPVANPKPLAAPRAAPAHLTVSHTIEAPQLDSLRHPQPQESDQPQSLHLPQSGAPPMTPIGGAPPAVFSGGQRTGFAPLGTAKGDTENRSAVLQTKPWNENIASNIEGSNFGQNHPTAGKILGNVAQVGGSVLDSLIPRGVAQRLPYTEAGHALQLSRADKQLAETDTSAGKQATTAETNARIPLTQAQTAHTEAETEGLPAQQKANRAHTEAETTALSAPKAVETSAGLLQVKPDGTAQRVMVDGKPVGPVLKTEVKQIEVNGKPHQVLINSQTGDHLRDLGETGEKPPVVSVNAGEKNLWSVPQPDGSKKAVSIRAGDTIPKGAVSLSGQSTETVAQGKPTADEQRRSDLTENLNENLSALEEIISRRPELFGPLAGRWSELRGKFGSDDPDIGALQTIEHQLGMAQISAHGMRSAQGIQTAADSIMNHMHSSPRALMGAIEAARNSVSTFTGDVDRKTGAAPSQSGAPKGAAAKPDDPLGIR